MKRLQRRTLNEALDPTQVDDFKTRLRNGIIHFAFNKKSTGERREARGTMKKELLPPPPPNREYDPAALANKKPRMQNPNIIRYYDLDAHGFRSFDISTFVEELS